MKKYVYHVGFREVYVNTVKVSSNLPLTREDAIELAREEVEAGDEGALEYSFTMDNWHTTVEGSKE